MLISQEIHDDIVKGFTLGNSEVISPHTAEIVELILPDYEGNLSKDMTNKKLNAFSLNLKSAHLKWFIKAVHQPNRITLLVN